jgi:hypothetical protein
MADVNFRDYLPYFKSPIAAPLTVTDDTPTFTTMNTLVIADNIPAGEYVLTICWEWWMPDVNDSALFKIIPPLTTGTVYQHEPKDAGEVTIRTASQPITYSGGAITILTQASKTVGASDLHINWSTIEFERKV